MDGHATPVGALSIDDFALLLSEHFELEPSVVTADAVVTSDLGLDSIGVFELVMIVEDLGVDLTDEQLAQLATVQDWHAAYRLGLDTR